MKVYNLINIEGKPSFGKLLDFSFQQSLAVLAMATTVPNFKISKKLIRINHSTISANLIAIIDRFIDKSHTRLIVKAKL